MNREDIIKLAREAGLVPGPSPTSMLERFAALVAAAATEEANRRANASWTLMCEKMVATEREACAQVCGELHWPWRMGDNSGPKECAAAIRARGQV